MSTNRKRSTPTRIEQPPQQDNTALGATALAAGGSMLGGAGGATLTSCPPDDNSFYCQFVKGFNIFKMLLFIIVILVVGYFLYITFFGSNKSAKRR